MEKKHNNFFIRKVWIIFDSFLLFLKIPLESYAPKVDQNLIADQHNFRAKYSQNDEENWTKK